MDQIQYVIEPGKSKRRETLCCLGGDWGAMEMNVGVNGWKGRSNRFRRENNQPAI